MLLASSLPMSTMVYKVVSTKLSEDEHERLLDLCNQEGLTPSALIKKSILMRIDPQEKSEEESMKKMTIDDLREYLGLKKK